MHRPSERRGPRYVREFILRAERDSRDVRAKRKRLRESDVREAIRPKTTAVLGISPQAPPLTRKAGR